MKIVHLCLACFFPDNYSYQENMLPKFHKLQGYDVEVIASLETFDNNGKISYYKNSKRYINENNVLVTRLEYKKPFKMYVLFRRFRGLKEALERAEPEILFIHGCQFCDIDVVCDYLKRHKSISVFVDNHADFSNSATNWVSRKLVHGIIWKKCAKKIEPYTKKFYGVLPARVDFLMNIYGLPSGKCELLVMGADDDLVREASNPAIRKEIRKKYGVDDDDFLIVTGGKIDKFKMQTLLLMEAVRNIENPKVKLIVFGSVTQELQYQVENLTLKDKVLYIGWVQSKDSYKIFAASDLVVFPGRHSVFWEQVVAQGIPMICKKWDGTQHVDLGGNVRFLVKDSSEEIQLEINELISNVTQYNQMKKVAMERGMKTFSYADIAKRAVALEE